MDILIYVAVVCLLVLLLFDRLLATEERQATPQDEPHEQTPEVAPDIYAMALARLLVEAELRGLEQAIRNGDDEMPPKGAKV